MIAEGGGQILRSKIALIVFTLIVGMVGGGVTVAAVRVVDGPRPPLLAFDPTTPDGTGDVSVDPNPSRAETPVTTASDKTPSLAGLRVSNRRGGYVFVRPAEWNVTTDGAHTELRSPGGNVVFSFGPAPGGGLPDAATAIVRRYSPDFEEMNIASSYEETTEQGLPTWVIGGTA